MQKQIEYGYKWFNGVVLNNMHTDKYNHYSDEINRYNSSPIQFAEKIEQLKDERHQFLTLCFDIYNA